jgi:hypothetical protein
MGLFLRIVNYTIDHKNVIYFPASPPSDGHATGGSVTLQRHGRAMLAGLPVKR